MRHLNNTIRGVGALIIVLAFIIGVPTGLVAFVGWPLPTSLPTLDQIQLAFRSGIDPQLLINALAVVVWIVWAQLVTALIAESIAAVRGRTARRLPVLPGLQPTVAQLVAAITLAAATLGPLRAVPATATPLPAEFTLTSSHPAVDLDHEPSSPRWAESTQPHKAEPQPTYQVMRHDTLWSIAETTLGDGRRWNEIRALNEGRTMPDGHSFTETTNDLTPGWLLLLPNDATTPAEDNRTEIAGVVTVRPGDNFWTIAETTLANAWGRQPTEPETSEYWRHLVDTNREHLAPPYDPDRIYPDQRFELPPVPTDPQVDAAEATGPDRPERQRVTEATVEAGDSFWSIAETALSDAWDRTPSTAETTHYWNALVDVNRDRLAPPHDPNLIHRGQRFLLPTIPDDPRNPAEPDTGLERPRLAPNRTFPSRRARSSPKHACHPISHPQPRCPLQTPTRERRPTPPIATSRRSQSPSLIEPMLTTTSTMGVSAASSYPSPAPSPVSESSQPGSSPSSVGSGRYSCATADPAPSPRPRPRRPAQPRP